MGRRVNALLSEYLGLPMNPAYDVVFAAQSAIENDYGRQLFGNNPLNLRPIPGGWPGQSGVSSGGFAMFVTLEYGIIANAQNYASAAYLNVQASMQRGDLPAELARAIERSPWDAGHYGGTLEEPGSLVALVTQLEGTVDYSQIEEQVKATIRVMLESEEGANLVYDAIQRKYGPALQSQLDDLRTALVAADFNTEQKAVVEAVLNVLESALKPKAQGA